MTFQKFCVAAFCVPCINIQKLKPRLFYHLVYYLTKLTIEKGVHTTSTYPTEILYLYFILLPIKGTKLILYQAYSLV